MGTKIDLCGKKFGRLLVTDYNKEVSKSKGSSSWDCICECGNQTTVLGYMLRGGRTQSCGCLQRQLASQRKQKSNRYEFYDDRVVGYDSKGNSFVFDIDDYDIIKEYCWRIRNDGYADAKVRNGSGKRILMHRLILNVTNKIDHINHNRADNRKSNLREVTDSQNCMNRSVHKNNTSKHTGVIWHKRDKVWESFISIDNKQIYLGRYTDINDAIAVRKEAEEKYFKQYSYDNSKGV